MKNMFARFMLVLALTFNVLPCMISTAHAIDVNIPSYVGSDNAETQIKTKGEKITKVIIIAAVVVIVAGLAVAAGCFGMGKKELGMKILGGGVAGLILLSLIGAVVSMLIG